MGEQVIRTPETQLDPAAQTALFSYYGLDGIEPPKTSGNGNHPYVVVNGLQRAYPFTTENMTDYIGRLDLCGKDIAAVCGSGDFAINAYAEGARSIDNIDMMETACMYAELKTAGVVALSQAEFLDFFANSDNYKKFGYSAYQKLRSELSEQTSSYFDALIKRKGPKDFLAYGLFIDKIGDHAMSRIMNPYLSTQETYDTASSNIGKVLFHATSMTDFLKSVRPDSYDLIYASNIAGYMESGQDVNELLTTAHSRLRQGGRIVMFSFLYPGSSLGFREAEEERLAESVGMKAGFIIGSVPHMGEDSGFKSVVSVFEKAA